MAFVAQIVDASDPSLVLFDLADDSQTSDWSQSIGNPATALYEFNLSRPDLQATRFEFTNAPGGTTVAARDPLVTASMRLRIFNTADYDSLAKAVGYLAQLLRAGGVIRWIPDGATETRYIDFEPSTAAALLSGTQFELNYLTTQFEKPEGVEITYVRQPYLSGDELDPTLNIAVNSTLLGYNGPPTSPAAPDLWAWSSTTGITATNVDPVSEAYEFTAATSAARSLQQTTPAASVGNSQAWTFAFDARAVAVAGTPKMKAAFQPLVAAGTANGAEIVGSSISLTTGWQRISVTGSTPASLTDKAQLSLRLNNLDATSVVLQVRNAQFEPSGAASEYRTGVETIYNNPAKVGGFGQMFPLWVSGNAPGVLELRIAPSATQGLAAVGAAYDAPDSLLTDLLNKAKVSQFESWTVSTDTATNVDAGGSGSSPQTLLTTWVTNSLAKRASTTITDAVTLGALAGRSWAVRARVRGSGGTNGVAGLQLRWAWGNTGAGSVLSEAETRVTLGTTPWPVAQLGILTFPSRIADGLYLEAWAEKVSGDRNLEWDYLEFMPADRFVVIASNGNLSVLDSSYQLSLSTEGVQLVTSTDTIHAFPPTFQQAGALPTDPPPGLLVIGIDTDRSSGANALTDTFTVYPYLTPRFYV